MKNHSGYQRQLILARITRVDECIEIEMEAEAESEETSPSGISEESRCLVIEFERLIAVALSRGFTRDDVEDLYGLADYDLDLIVRDRMSESVVEAAIQAREDSLFDALVALVPETISTGQGQ